MIDIVTYAKDKRNATGSGGSGSSGVTSAALASALESLDDFVRVDWFKKIFIPVDSDLNELTVNGGTSSVSAIKAKFDFYSVGTNSALGAAAAGSGGGGADLGALLTAMNGLDVPTTAGTYVLNVSGDTVTLVAETTGGGTGGGITLAQMWASLTTASDAYAASKIASAHIPNLYSLSYDGTYTLAQKLSSYLSRAEGAKFDNSNSNYIAARFYNNGTYDDTRMAVAHNKYIEWYSGDDYGWMNHAMGHVILVDSSNQIWANTSGTVKFNLPSSSGTLALTSDLHTHSNKSVLDGITSTLVGNWNTAYNNNHTHSNKSVLDGITSTYVSHWNTAYSNTHTHSNKSVLDGITSTYVSHWNTAYGWGNHADAGYLLISQGLKFINYGSYIAARFFNADGTTDSNRASLAQGDGYIEWWSSGGYFNHQLGNLEAKGNVEVGTSTTDTTHYLQVGGAKLMWDNSSRSLYVIGADGNACNFYSSGGNSALGIPTSSTTSLNSLSIGTLTVTGNQTIGGTLTVTDTLTASGNVSVSGTLSGVVSATTLQVGSGTTISNIYWTGSKLRFYIGGNYYYFTPD